MNGELLVVGLIVCMGLLLFDRDLGWFEISIARRVRK